MKPTIAEYIESLIRAYSENADPERARQQSAYLKNQFGFFGMGTTDRRKVQAPFLVRNQLPDKEHLDAIVKELWSRPQREFHYFGQELCAKYLRKHDPTDLELYVHMVQNQSWWDTVDFIAVKLMGSYFKHYPEKRGQCVDQWLQSGNMWLQRSVLLFQLKYKDALDTQLLERAIHPLKDSTEFFIKKAIGWVLREYSKTNADWVMDFVERVPLQNLSKKEALRLIE